MKIYAAILLCTAMCAVPAGVSAEPADKSLPESAARMHDYLAAVSQIKDAIIRGDLPGTHEPARWLAEHAAPEETPAGWHSHVEGVRVAARSMLTAKDFRAAAMLVTEMADTCGACHEGNRVTNNFAVPPAPGDELAAVAHMQRHGWAADRMWEGLIGPSDVAWQQGTELLLETPLAAHEMGTDDNGAFRIRRWAMRVHELAADGRLAEDPGQRADIYAELLTICAACHRRLGRGPQR
ncbi:MAG: hypothetical protein HKO55_08230 [Gammaproteobacteria bacterium]|nr:hypothetical protein [Gammaproteobacteria bacterium]